MTNENSDKFFFVVMQVKNMTNLNKGNVKQSRKEGGGHSGSVLIKNQSLTKQRKEIQYIDNFLIKLKLKLSECNPNSISFYIFPRYVDDGSLLRKCTGYSLG